MQAFLFYSFSGLAILSALAAITLSKPTRALLSLIVTMFCLTVLFLMLGAQFVAMTHLIVYAGAVLVLFLFVIMMQGVEAKDTPLRERFSPAYFVLVTFVTIAFFSSMIFLLSKLAFKASTGVQGNVETVARELFRNYLGPFELTSLLLLVGLFAAVNLAKKDASS